jgi:SAM-dependent methyltransferase
MAAGSTNGGNSSGIDSEEADRTWRDDSNSDPTGPEGCGGMDGVLMTGYVFETADLLDEQRKYMQESLDPMTIARLESLGVGPGWRCLDVGGGGGSIARWLGERVGDNGHVLVTDVDTGGLASAGNVTVRLHDIVDDELPDAEFDLVHARLVLLHLAQRDRALTRMVRALKPGGWLLLVEFDCTWMPVLSAPDDAAAALFGRFHAALCHLLSGSGADIAWGVRAYRALQDQGLVELGNGAHAEAWPGDSSGCRWLHVNSLQLQEQLIGTGLVTDVELDALRGLLTDPTFVASSYLTISTWGRRANAG